MSYSQSFQVNLIRKNGEIAQEYKANLVRKNQSITSDILTSGATINLWLPFRLRQNTRKNLEISQEYKANLVRNRACFLIPIAYSPFPICTKYFNIFNRVSASNFSTYSLVDSMLIRGISCSISVTVDRINVQLSAMV